MDQPIPAPIPPNETERQPHVIIAPGMLEHDHELLREPDEDGCRI